MDAFLAFECGISALERLAVSYYEFRVLEHGWKAQRESEERLVRTQCFYAIAPHRGKKSNIREPEDLWRIGEEVGRGIVLTDADRRRKKRHQRLLKKNAEALGFTINIE